MYGAVPLLIGGTLGLIGGAVTVAKADSNACETNTSSPECGGADKSVGAGVLGASSTAILVGVAFVAIGGLEVQIVEPSYAGGAVPSVALRGTGAELSWAF